MLYQKSWVFSEYSGFLLQGKLFEGLTVKYLTIALNVECIHVLFQAEIVSSLLLSMLKQMFAEDRNDSVRATVIKSLALVMTIVESPTKYKEACIYIYIV